MIKCKICGKKFRNLQPHLATHNISVEEYKEKFSVSRIFEFTEEHKKKISKAKQGQKRPDIRGDKNPAKRPEVRKKISEKAKGCRGWSKGLTAETDERVRRQVEPKKNTTYEELVGKEKAKRWKKRQSEAMSNRSFSKEHKEKLKGPRPSSRGDNNPAKRLEVRKKISEKLTGRDPTYPKPYYIEELNHKVRSTWEEKIGKILQNNGIKYEYEGKKFKFDGTSYTPDFVLENNILIEPHAFFFDWQIEKYKNFNEKYSEYTFIVIGAGDKSICDIHLKWEEKDKLIPLLENLV